MTEYYYLGADNQRRGPFTQDQLLAEGITAETLVWKAGLPQWVAAKEVPELAAQLSSTATPPPPPERNTFCNGNQKCPCPPTNLIWGILCTIFCCLPLGIVAVYKSSKVETYYYRGEIAKAEKASQSAANWCIASITIAVLLNLGFFSLFSIGQLALIAAFI